MRNVHKYGTFKYQLQARLKTRLEVTREFEERACVESPVHNDPPRL